MEATRQVTLFLHKSGSIYHVATDVKGKYTYVNELYKKIFFNNPMDGEERFQSTVFPEDLELFNDTIRECKAFPRRTVCTDLRRVRSDGSIFWIRWEFGALFEDGEFAGFQALGTDATERKRAEEEKREAQEKLSRERYLLRTLIDHLPDSIYVKDRELRFIITNRAKLDLIGAETEEGTVGKTLTDFLDPEHAGELIKNDEIVFETGEALVNREEYLITNDGEKRWLLTTRVPLQEDENNMIGLVGISRDITDHKKIEETLRMNIERFNIVSKATNDAIWDWDLVNNTVFWNDAVYSLFGFGREEIVTDPTWWEKHIHEDDQERVVTRVHRHIKERIESWQDEYRFVCADGSIKWVLDRGHVVFDDRHTPYRMIGAMMDITERKKLLDELANQSIARQKIVTEATMMGQEKERAEIGRELHDNINQILTTTKMYLDMALTEKDISEELMIKSHENISSAIEEIRSLSKSLVPPSLGDIGIKEAIAEMIASLNVSQKLNIRLKTSGISTAEIPGNVQLMVFRIVQEQVSNVIKHAKATEAEIKLIVHDKDLKIVITDNGIGFDPRKRGKGIGLMNITSRAEVHNGTVDVLSAPGKGCTLKISIPL
jgi:two-component system sensor histidine kinase UhpB